MKKFLTTIICVVLIAAMAIALFACNPAKDDDPAPVDVQAVFEGALAKYIANNFTAKGTISAAFGNSGSLSWDIDYRTDGANSDFTAIAALVENRTGTGIQTLFERYQRDGKAYLLETQNQYGVDKPLFGLERNQDSFYGYALEEEKVKNYTDFGYIYSDYIQYFIAALGEYVFSGDEAVVNGDGSVDFNFSMDLMPVLKAAMNMKQTIGAYIDGILAALGSEDTVASIIDTLALYLNDDITMGELQNKVDELMKTINPALSFEKLLDLVLLLVSDDGVPAEGIYEVLSEEVNSNISKNRPGESAKEYILRLFKENADVKAADFLLANLPVSSLSNALTLVKTLAYLLEAYPIVLSEFVDGRESDLEADYHNIGGFEFMGTYYENDGTKLFHDIFKEIEDELVEYCDDMLSRILEIIPTFFTEISVNVSASVNAAGEFSKISAGVSAAFDASAYLYAFASDNEIDAFSLPGDFDPSTSIYDEDKDTEEIFELVYLLQQVFSGYEVKIDNNDEEKGYLFPGSYKLQASLVFSNYGATEVISEKKLKVDESSDYSHKNFRESLKGTLAALLPIMGD